MPSSVPAQSTSSIKSVLDDCFLSLQKFVLLADIPSSYVNSERCVAFDELIFEDILTCSCSNLLKKANADRACPDIWQADFKDNLILIVADF